MSSILVPGFWVLLVILLLLAGWRLSVLCEQSFCVRGILIARAARALGVSDSTIIFRHVLPNAMVATITMLPYSNWWRTALTSLDFLGLGLPPGSPP